MKSQNKQTFSLDFFFLIGNSISAIETAVWRDSHSFQSCLRFPIRKLVFQGIWRWSHFNFSEHCNSLFTWICFSGCSVPAEFLWEPPGAGSWAYSAAVLWEHPPQRRLAEARCRRHSPVFTAAQSAPRLSQSPRRLLQPLPHSLQRGPPSIIAASAPPQYKPEQETRAYLQQASFL